MGRDYVISKEYSKKYLKKLKKKMKSPDTTKLDQQFEFSHLTKIGLIPLYKDSLFFWKFLESLPTG